MGARERRLELSHSASGADVAYFGLPAGPDLSAGFYFHVQLKAFVSAAGTLTIEPRAAWEDAAGDLLRASWVPYTASTAALGLTLPLPLGEGGGEGPGAASPAHLITAAFLTAHDHQLSFDTCFIYQDYLDPATGAATETDQVYTYDLGPHANQILEVRDGHTGNIIYQNVNGSGPAVVKYSPEPGVVIELSRQRLEARGETIVVYLVERIEAATAALSDKYQCLLETKTLPDGKIMITPFARVRIFTGPDGSQRRAYTIRQPLPCGLPVDVGYVAPYPFLDEAAAACPCPCDCPRLFAPETQQECDPDGCERTTEGETLNPQAGANTGTRAGTGPTGLFPIPRPAAPIPRPAAGAFVSAPLSLILSGAGQSVALPGVDILAGGRLPPYLGAGAPSSPGGPGEVVGTGAETSFLGKVAALLGEAGVRVLQFVGGAGAALADDLAWGALSSLSGNDPRAPDQPCVVRLGAAVGDAAAMALGILEMLGGAGLAAGSVALAEIPGVGWVALAVAGPEAFAAAGALAAHGALTCISHHGVVWGIRGGFFLSWFASRGGSPRCAGAPHGLPCA